MRRRPLHAQQAREEADSGERESNGGAVEEKTKTQYQTTEPYNPIAWLAVVFHLAMVVFYSLLLYHGRNIIHDNVHILDPTGKIPSYGGRFKYLTHINQWVQLAFFALQFITDLLPKSSTKNKFQNVSDLFFTSLAVPLSLVVTLVFWGLYAVDRKLIYPEVFDKFVPPYLNHFWHTTIALWILFEIILVVHRFPSIALAASFVFVYSTAYISWVVWVFVKTGWWIYPVLKVLPPHMMALFFASNIFLSLGLHLVGKGISYLRWGSVWYIEF